MKLLIANWKMYLDREASRALAAAYAEKPVNTDAVEMVVAPNFLFWQETRAILQPASIGLCAQDAAPTGEGAFTGEVSAELLRDNGAKYVLIGHSERREKLAETDSLVAQKLQAIINSGLTPVLCVGETVAERSAAQRDAVLSRQLQSALSKVKNIKNSFLIIAYEPVWAIGTGEALPPKEFVAAAKIIKRTVAQLLTERYFNANVRILYGGSVNSENAAGFWKLAELDGLLVGKSGLQVNELISIVDLVK